MNGNFDFQASSLPSQVHVNPSQSVLVLEGDDIESFNRAVQQVTYRNSLRFATPGVRPLKLTTSLRYKSTRVHIRMSIRALFTTAVAGSRRR